MLVDALNSVLSQNYKPLEIIVVNDAGRNIEEVINRFKTKDNIIYRQHEINKGLAAARNTGVQIARGKYIAYLDDDDIFYPDHIETLVDHLKNSPSKIAYTDAYRAHQIMKNGKYVITKKDLPYSFDFDYDRILTENFIPVLCILHEKSCLQEIGLWDANLRRTEDWDLWIRMSRKYQFAHIKKSTCEFRWRTDGSSMMNSHQEPFAWAALNMFYKYQEFGAAIQIQKIQETIVHNSLMNLSNCLRKGLGENNKCAWKLLEGGSLEQLIERSKYLERMYRQEKALFQGFIHILEEFARDASPSEKGT